MGSWKVRGRQEIAFITVFSVSGQVWGRVLELSKGVRVLHAHSNPEPTIGALKVTYVILGGSLV